MTETTETATKTELLTAPEIAAYMGVSPKALRRFIRSQDAACGQGNRYGFTPEEAKALIRDFADRPARSTETRSAEDIAALLETDKVDEADEDNEVELEV